MDVTQTSAAAPNPVAQPESAKPAISSDFETFLRMLTVQMQNQDPLNPIESSDYAVQLATFSGVEQQVRTNDLLSSLAQQMGFGGLSQMAGWVGMEARVEAPAYFEGAPVTVSTDAYPGADKVELVVSDDSGNVVERTTIDAAGGQFDWAGVDADGDPFPAGNYTFNVEVTKDGALGATDAAQIYATVTEVRTENGAPVVVLASGATVSADLVTAIRNPG